MNFVATVQANVTKWCVNTFKKAGVRQWTLAALVFILLGGMLIANVVTEPVDLWEGQVAKRDITAPFRVVNSYRTDILRSAEADRAVKAVVDDDSNYVVNQAVSVRGKERINQAFRMITETAAGVGDESVISTEQLESLRTRLESQLGMVVPVTTLERIVQTERSRLIALEEVATQFAGMILQQERIKEDNIELLQAGLTDRLVGSEEYSRLLVEEPERTLVVAMTTAVMEPNLVLDLQRLNQAMDNAMREVKPVYVERGQIVVRKGDLVTEEDVSVLRDLGLLGTRSNYTTALGLLLVLALVMALFGVYLYQYKREVLADEGHMALLGLLLVLVAAVVKALSFFPSEAAGYLAPIALATILITILLDAQIGMMSSIFLTIIVGLTMGQEFKFATVALVSGLAGVFSVSQVGERSDLTRAGMFVGLAGFLTMLSLGLLRTDMFMVKYSFLGIVNGLVSAVGAIGLFPYLESVFRITSTIRLLELSNPNQPLLRKLLMEAPGTYHHSMIVGNLAEAAVEAIGGDSLLTRVGAQYHDIGKTKRPYFFIENQYGGENPHDKISPHLSTLIITSHVKDGVDLARKHRLPECVIDFIRQHHGTSLVKYFYHKACENAKEDTCDEKDFRYAGPRPQTKEIAVVLLADSVEAAVRTLGRATPGRIEGLVRKIIKDHLADGQLDESNITLRDLDKVADAFVKVLTGIFHNRVDYPESVLQEMEANRA